MTRDRPRVRVIHSNGRAYYGQDREHLHDSIAAAADAARREAHGWLGPRTGIRGAPSADAAPPIQVWAYPYEGWSR